MIIAAASSALAAGVASAQSTYTGGATTSAPATGNWNNAANWSPPAIPAGGVTQTLSFLGGPTAYTSTDDIAGTFALNQLTLGSNASGTTIASSGVTNVLSFQGTNASINQTAAGTFIISAPVDLPVSTALTQITGAEVDFTGPVTSSASGGLSLTNSSGTGNSTVKFTGSNTFSGLTVNANVSAYAGLSANLTTLGSGTVTLAGGKLYLQGQQANGFAQQALGVSGFNADTIMDAAASTTANGHVANVTVTDNTIQQGNPPVGNGTTYTSSLYTTGASIPSPYEASDITSVGHIHNQTTLFQSGWNLKTDGVSASGLITSSASSLGTNHVFNFAYNGTSTNFAALNTLYFTNGAIVDMAPKTLMLANPTQVQTLNFLATAYVSSVFDITLNFADGTHDTYASQISTGSISAPANQAYSVKGTNNGNSANSDNGSTVKFSESDTTLTAADQQKTLSSITFTPDTIGTVLQGLYNNPSNQVQEGSAEIYAVSGIAFGNGIVQPTQSYSNNVSVTASSSIDVSGSLVATMGNISIGSTLSVTSSSSSASPYSLTVGSVTLAGPAGFSVTQSSGGGAGTLNLGALNDGGTPQSVTIANGTGGTVALTAAATSLVAGTTANVLGTLNVNVANAWGGAGTILNVSGGTLNLNSADALGTVAGGILNITSGVVNGNIANAATLAQVNMSGGTFALTSNQQVSSLSGSAGTVSAVGASLVVGNNADNLSSTFGGVFTGAVQGNFSYGLGHSGTGDLTITGTSNTQLVTEVNNGSITMGAASTQNLSSGVVSGPFGSAYSVVMVGSGGGTPVNAALYLDVPGRTLLNTVYFSSGPSGIAGVGGQPGTGEEMIAGLNTTGTTTIAGDVVLGSGNTGAFGNNGAAVIAVSNGGELDVTGNITANHNHPHTELTVRNLTGTGNAVVKVLGLNNTYRMGTEIDPNVTLVAPLTTSTRALGYGPVILVGGTLNIQGQLAHGVQMANLVTNTGFNQKIIVPMGASNASSATTATIDGASVLYQSGYVSSTSAAGPNGLNASGLYTSEYNPDVQFQLQPYTGNTALQFKNGQASTGTLNLATPGPFKTINILSMNGPAVAAVTFNFAGGTSETQFLNFQNWAYGQANVISGGATLSNAQRLAIGGTNTTPGSGPGPLPATRIGSINRSTDSFSGDIPAAGYEDDFTLAPADQSKMLTSISFSVPNLTATSTSNILAISGQTYVAPTTLSTQTYVNNVSVLNANVPTGTINVTGSLNAVMGNNLSMGNTSLGVISSDTSGSPYSLTLGTLPDTLDSNGTAPAVSLLGQTVGAGPTFNISNSAGGGAGTVILGALDDHLALDPNTLAIIPQLITKIGAGSLTLSAPVANLWNGTMFNVTSGTLNSNDPLAVGTGSTFNVAASLNFGANDNTGSTPVAVTVAAMNVSGTGRVAVLNPGSGAPRTVLVITGPNALSISSGGKLDLNANDLIVQGGSLTAVTSLLASGYNSGSWNGSGIASGSAQANTTHLTALGSMASTGASFDGQPTTAGDVLIKYTYYGDANLDGQVDGSDYSRIDNAYVADRTNPTAFTGWANGDFNYDGVIDGSDYTLIDNAFNSQYAQISSELAVPTAQLAAGAGSSAVPEPAALCVLGIGAAGLLGRRGRRR